MFYNCAWLYGMHWLGAFTDIVCMYSIPTYGTVHNQRKTTVSRKKKDLLWEEEGRSVCKIKVESE